MTEPPPLPSQNRLAILLIGMGAANRPALAQFAEIAADLKPSS